MTIRKTSKGGITRYLSEPRAASAAAPAPVATAASPAGTAGERHTPPLRISRNLLERFGRNPNETRMPERRFEAFAPAKHPPQVEAEVPTDDRLAMDDALVEYANGAVQPYASDLFFNGLIAEGQAFLGFPYLAMLAQRAEYRRMSERFATEMTRKWIKLKASGDEDYTDKLKEIDEELKRLGAKLKFREAAEHDAFFGRGHIVFDFGTGKGLDRDELATPIGDGRDAASQLKVEKGSLKRIVVVEPVWMYPMAYNTTDPLSEDFYKPTIWNTQGRQIHASRVMTFVGREVPDLLKAAYSFGGLSLTQMAKPYVDNWLRTRQAVTDLVESFSVSGLMTDLSAVLAGGEGDIVGRVDFYNATRSNRGMMLIDKDREEFFNISTPLSGLDHLQAQSLEQLSAVSGIPLVILLGITPSGLNASSEGEIRAFQDLVHAHQELLFGDNLRTLLRVVQMSLFGEVFPDIGFEFVDLGGISEKEQAEIRKIDAETANVYMDAGVISAGEERERIANDEHTIYPAIDPEDVPDATPEEQDDIGEGSDQDDDAGTEAVEGSTEGSGSSVAAKAIAAAMAGDAAQPRTLYVRRDVLPASKKAIARWASEAGLGEVPDDLHVTLLYSRNPVDWLKVGDGGFGNDRDGNLTVRAGGPRVVERFGNFVVLAFANSDLQYRHSSAMQTVPGISWDHPDYTPHISVLKGETDVDLSKIAPFTGAIELGPELFDVVKED